MTKDRGFRQVITARAVANATGAWTSSVAETVCACRRRSVAALQRTRRASAACSTATTSMCSKQ